MRALQRRGKLKMAARRATKLPAPYLRSLRMRDGAATLPPGYPFALPWVSPEFELSLEEPVTILIGENGSGKSTLLEAIAALAGFQTGGGGKWAGGDLDSGAADAEALAAHLVAGWLPKVGEGWFLKAQSFAAVAGVMEKDYLGYSHGEGFSELITDRMEGQGIYLLDEPEAALSPRKQAELLRFLSDIQNGGDAQVVLATHSPILMAVPDAAVLRIDRHGIERVDPRQTDHFRIWSAFTADPDGFVQAVLDDELELLL